MNKLFPILTALTIAALSMASPPVAQACGDKLTVLGGGLPFDRIHTNHRHGSVILFLSPDSRLAATNGDVALDRTLTRAGHRVRSVRTSAELRQALGTAQVDFVLMDWSEARQLQAGLGTSVPVVPVTYGGSAEERAVAQSRSGCVVQSTRGRGRQLVREVEALLENQSGLASSCAESLATTSG